MRTIQHAERTVLQVGRLLYQLGIHHKVWSSWAVGGKVGGAMRRQQSLLSSMSTDLPPDYRRSTGQGQLSQGM